MAGGSRTTAATRHGPHADELLPNATFEQFDATIPAREGGIGRAGRA